MFPLSLANEVNGMYVGHKARILLSTTTVGMNKKDTFYGDKDRQ